MRRMGGVFCFRVLMERRLVVLCYKIFRNLVFTGLFKQYLFLCTLAKPSQLLGLRFL